MVHCNIYRLYMQSVRVCSILAGHMYSQFGSIHHCSVQNNIHIQRCKCYMTEPSVSCPVLDHAQPSRILPMALESEVSRKLHSRYSVRQQVYGRCLEAQPCRPQVVGWLWVRE